MFKIPRVLLSEKWWLGVAVVGGLCVCVCVQGGGIDSNRKIKRFKLQNVGKGLKTH